MESVWVVSFPKSGNTWVRTLLKNYVELKYGNPPMETSDAVPYSYHVVSPYPVSNLTQAQIIQLRPAAMMHLIALCNSSQYPAPINIIKSHAAAHQYMGVVLHSPLWMNHTIYVYRDPRDILPSIADHMGNTLPDALKMMNDERAFVGELPKIPTPVSSWSENVNSWLTYKLIRPLPISYERLHDDSVAVLGEIVDYCNLDKDEALVRKAVKMSTFAKMQAHEAKHGFHEKSEHQKRFFRRGIVGSHKLDVDPKYTRQVENDHGGMMMKLGYLDA